MASIGSSSPRSSSDNSYKRKGAKRLHAAPRPPPPEDDLFDTHFEKLIDPIAGDLKVICNYCARLFKFRSDEKEFGNLKSHFDDTYCSKIRNGESEEEEEEERSSQGSTGSTGTCVEVSASAYSYKNARKMIARFICDASLPFDIAESGPFEKLLKACNPLGQKVPSVEIIREIAKLVRESLLVLKKDLVKLSNKVSICCDVWTNELEWQFVRITCHWVDESWTIQKRLIAFRVLYEGTRTPAEIAQELQKTLQNYGLDSKAFSISFDNQTASTHSLEALTNDLQPSISANFFYARCLNNILTMCVQDVLSALEKEYTVIRNAARRISFADTSLLRKWAAFCKKKGLVPRCFLIDYPGSWDLSYRMMNGCYEYRDALCSFFVEEKLKDVQVGSSQFEACSSLHQLLGTFYQVVEELSRVYQPTSVLVLDNCVKIAVLFHSLASRDGLAGCVAKMKGKWLKHFEEIPTVFLLAKVFDPRIRLDGVEKMLEIYYDALFPIKTEKTPIPSLIVANVKKCLYDLFQEYSMKHGARLGMNVSSSSSRSDENPLLARLQNLFDEFSMKRPRCYGPNPYGELESYLTASFEYMSEFDILRWWSRMTMQFPVMSLIAKDILATPALTVSVEQAFGTEGYELDQRMSDLTEQDHLHTVENQLLLGDWMKAEDRRQENDYDDYGDMGDPISDSELDD